MIQMRDVVGPPFLSSVSVESRNVVDFHCLPKRPCGCGSSYVHLDHSAMNPAICPNCVVQ